MDFWADVAGPGQGATEPGVWAGSVTCYPSAGHHFLTRADWNADADAAWTLPDSAAAGYHMLSPVLVDLDGDGHRDLLWLAPDAQEAGFELAYARGPLLQRTDWSAADGLSLTPTLDTLDDAGWMWGGQPGRSRGRDRGWSRRRELGGEDGRLRGAGRGHDLRARPSP